MSALELSGGSSLPDWWTVDSTPGSESVEFGGFVSVIPGGASGGLDVRSGPGWGGVIASFYDEGYNYGFEVAPEFAQFFFSGDTGSNRLRLRVESDDIFVVGPTGAVTISPSDDQVAALTLQGSNPLAGGPNGALRFVNGTGSVISDSDAPILLTDVESWSGDADGIYWEPDGAGSGKASFFVGADYAVQADSAGVAIANVGMPLGFFGVTPVAKPTGVAATGPGVHAALVTLGLIAA